MVGPSKILTVSYGTFSCTLEGFDDSFATMKAIAEYFRDLAADDRYFGAEPATPDADMLARIAEREVARRVEARMDASGITLRTGAALRGPAEIDDDAADMDAAPAMPPAPRPVPMAPLAAATTAFDDLNDQNTGAAVTADAAGFAAGRGTGDDPGDLSPTLAAPAPAAPVYDDPDADEPTPVRAAPPDADSVAAKLQRIRAVVGHSRADFDAVEDDTASADGYVDALDDNSDNQALHDALSGAMLNSVEAEDENITADDMAEDDESDGNLSDDSDTLAAMMARFDQAEDDDKAVADTVTVKVDEPVAITRTPTEPVVILTAPDEIPTVRARVIRMKRSDFERAVARGRLEAETDEEDDEAAADDLSALPDLAMLDSIDDLDGDTAADASTGLSAEEEAELLEELAEVERDSSDADDDLMVDDDADFEDDDIAMDNAAVALAGQPDDTDEADDTDDDIDDDTDDDLENPVESAHDPRPGRAILDTEPDADEAAMSRILSQTDAELREPEGNRRRQAIAQLKAAVAATEAARRMGEPALADDATENAFRDDLDQVVRPRRARADGLGRPDAERPRPAPLKLVASQRIDMPATVPAAESMTPVRPRRVQIESVAEVEVETDIETFADYAESVGATTLQDLLEAAAAYASFVEGMEDFSRPEIMKKVRQLSPEDFSREDGLRSFGTLLRQGRIAKIRNGRFQISDQTRFRPEALAARG